MFKPRLHIFDFRKPEPNPVFLTSEKGTYTYKDLEQFTLFFQDLLVKETDSLKWPIAFLSESSDALVFSIAASWKLGVPIVPLNPKSPQQELEDKVTALHPSLIFVDSKNRNRFTGDDVIEMDDEFFSNAISFVNPDKKSISEPEPDENQIFGYFFTSGTTSTPKIVPLKRRQMYAAAQSSSDNFKPDLNHYWLLCLPLNHVGGISIILRSLIYGSAIYRMKVFNEEMVKEFLSENKQFQAASLVPTMLKRLLNDSLFKTHHNFKAILLGGGPVTGQLIKETAERGIPIVSSYGMTETCAQIAANPMLVPSGIYTPLRSVGSVFPPNEIQIRDDNGKVVTKNESGMIWLRGPQVFDGYYNADNSTFFDENGWFNTGDFGHINGNRHLFIESRRTDLIITGGENVNPFEVEQAILELNNVKDAVVIGVPDEEWGQRVTAFITPASNDRPQLELVRNQLRDKLSDFKLPRDIKVIDRIPKTMTGKVKRNELLKLSHNN